MSTMDVDPNPEIEERIAAIQAVKRLKTSLGLKENLDESELDAVLPIGGQPVVLSPSPSPRVRRPSPALKFCPTCNGKINTFSGACHRCNSPAPTEADVKPVKVTTETLAEQPCSVCGKPFVPRPSKGRPFTRCEECFKHQRKPNKDRGLCTREHPHRGLCQGAKLPRPTRIDRALARPEPEPEPEAVREAELAMGLPSPPLTPETCRVVRLAVPDPELAAINAVARLTPEQRAKVVQCLAILYA